MPGQWEVQGFINAKMPVEKVREVCCLEMEKSCFEMAKPKLGQDNSEEVNVLVNLLSLIISASGSAEFLCNELGEAAKIMKTIVCHKNETVTELAQAVEKITHNTQDGSPILEFLRHHQDGLLLLALAQKNLEERKEEHAFHEKVNAWQRRFSEWKVLADKCLELDGVGIEEFMNSTVYLQDAGQVLQKSAKAVSRKLLHSDLECLETTVHEKCSNFLGGEHANIIDIRYACKTEPWLCPHH